VIIEMPPALATFLDGTHQSIVIGGERREARSGKTIDVRDPGTGEVIAQIAAGEADDVDLAVSDARRAFEEEWRDTKPAARERALLTLADHPWYRDYVHGSVASALSDLYKCYRGLDLPELAADCLAEARRLQLGG